MAVYLPKYKDKHGNVKQSKVYWMEFRFQSQEIRESTCTRSITLAKKIMDKRRRDLEEGVSGIRKRPRPQLFSFAAESYIEKKKTSLAPSSLLIERTNLKHLAPVFGKTLICDIEGEDVHRYQEARMQRGASPATVNLEIGTLRAILKRSGHWARLQPEVKMLKVRDDVGRAITPEEENALLRACSESRSRCLLTFVTIAIETGARFNVIRTLQWANVDFATRSLQFGKDKTKAGSGRIVPLNPRVLATLKFWAVNFPERKPEHFVFPSERYGGKGKKDDFGFKDSIPYDTDLARPIGDIKEGWEKAKRRAAEILKGDSVEDGEKINPLICRFHDLRHTAVSRMLEAGVPMMKVAKIVGWSPSTMVQMAARYGHFTLDELRGAVETISRGNGEQAFNTESRLI